MRINRVTTQRRFDASLVRLGRSTMIPAFFKTEVVEDGVKGRVVTLDIAMIGGIPRCVELAVKVEGGITKARMVRVPVQELVELAVTHAAMHRQDAPSTGLGSYDDAGHRWVSTFDSGIADGDEREQQNAAKASADARTQRRRRTVDDDLLREVADAYESAGRRIDAVAERFGVSHQQAYRYRRAAIDSGFIKETQKP